MSLINDALKRAQDSQAEPPPLPPAPPRAPRPTPGEPEHGNSKGMLIVLVVLLLVAAFGLAQVIFEKPEQAEAPAASNTETNFPDIVPAMGHSETATTTTAAPTNSPTTAPSETLLTNFDNVDPGLMAAVTNNAPTPEPIKVQGIIFAQPRPWAIISGKMLFVGDRVSDYRITAITKNTVTVQNDDGTVRQLSVRN